MHADTAPDPDAVGLIVEALGDERIVVAPGSVVLAFPRRREQVDGRGEGDPGAVGAPHRPAGTERQIGQRPWLASPGRQEPDLRSAVGGAEEADRRAVKGPRG